MRQIFNTCFEIKESDIHVGLKLYLSSAKSTLYGLDMDQAMMALTFLHTHTNSNNHKAPRVFDVKVEGDETDVYKLTNGLPTPHLGNISSRQFAVANSDH